MPIIKCQHSNLQFETSSKRSKQHPLVATLKEKAHKRGNYREACDALDKVAAAGGYSTIEEYIQLVQAELDPAIAEKKARENEALKAKYEAEKAARDRKKQRAATNGKLRQHGYRWHYNNPDHMHNADLSPSGWHLCAPDGRNVSVSQALDEIARGADVVLAEIEAARAEQAAREAEAEAKRAAEEAELDASIAAFDAVVAEIRENNTRVDAPTWQPRALETVARITNPRGYYRSRDIIQKFNINDAIVYRIVGGTGYGDDGRTEYYCADPAAAGLTVYEPPAMPDDGIDYSRFDDIFGF